MNDSALTPLNRVHLRTEKNAQERMKGKKSEDQHSKAL